MRTWLAAIFVTLASCGGGGSTPDSGTTPDGSMTTDGAAVIDSALSADAGPECNASSGPLAKAVGGPAGKSIILAINLSLNAGDSDGILGTVTQNGADLQLDDIAVFSPAVAFAPGAGAIHQIAHPEVGVFTATRLGDAPGITALAANSTDLFGAAGLTLSRITPTPFAVTPIGTITPPAGCTRIIDFVAPKSGGSFIFQMLLACGGTTRVFEAAWTPGTTTLRDGGFGLAGTPANAVGLSLGTLITADSKLYRWSSFGAGTLTLIRNLSPCLGTTPRGMQE